MSRPGLILLACLMLGAGAARAADPAGLRQALMMDDVAAIQAWLRQQATQPTVDPLAPLAKRPSDAALRAQSTALAVNELVLTALAASYASRPDPDLKVRLLGALDRSEQAQTTLVNEVERARTASTLPIATPPPPIVATEPEAPQPTPAPPQKPKKDFKRKLLDALRDLLD